jgi:hypothetical protein
MTRWAAWANPAKKIIAAINAHVFIRMVLLDTNYIAAVFNVKGN